MSKTKLVGISGCTNGGKTTLTKKLYAEFAPHSYHFSQDDFYHPRDAQHLEYIEELDSFNFDVISAINMEKFRQELNKIRESGKYEYIFVEGFLIYDDEKLHSMLDKKYFLHVTKEECLRRRVNRNYKSLDTPNYFDKCVWPEFIKYKQRCEATYNDIVYINGSHSPSEVFMHVLNDLMRHKTIF
jgi:uridine kinase